MAPAAYREGTTTLRLYALGSRSVDTPYTFAIGSDRETVDTGPPKAELQRVSEVIRSGGR
jgi:hypothetical protein